MARAAKEYLKRKRPDIQIVGEDLHPLAQVKDFAPYAAKIKASGADTVITGNWGCGSSCGGDAQLKSMLQWMAASRAGAPCVVYHTVGASSVVKVRETESMALSTNVIHIIATRFSWTLCAASSWTGTGR